MEIKILFSFHYTARSDLDKTLGAFPAKPFVFADSGALSALTLNAQIDIVAYADWLHKWRHWFTAYANLDVINDWKQSERNLRYLESRGLRPIPVFHGGEPMELLEDMVKTYPYIGLGGLATGTFSGSDEMWRFIIKCFEIGQGKSVYHGFGMTNWGILAAFPWYSVDSSSWGTSYRFGRVNVFDDRTGKWITLPLGRRQEWYRHSMLIRRYGYDPADFADRSRNERRKLAGLAALSYMAGERFLRKRHGEIVMPEPRTDNAGLHLYLADTNIKHHLFAAEAAAAASGLHIFLVDGKSNLGDVRFAAEEVHRLREGGKQ